MYSTLKARTSAHYFENNQLTINQKMPFRTPPPRDLSLYSQAVLLFSGFHAVFGWVFFGFGMIFFWLFTYNSTCMLWFNAPKNWITHEAQVKKLIPTNALENEEEIYKVRYVYFVLGQEYSGRGYFTGEQYETGDKALIEYNEENPAQSRIVGGRSKMFGWWAIFVALFPLIGLGFIAYSINKNLKSLYLIKNGIFTHGVMKSKKATGGSIEINKVEYPIYKYEFEFEVQGQSHIAHCTTHQSQVVEDDVEEFILYDYQNPTFNTVYDAIPNAPTVDGLGYLQDIPLKKAYVLAAPALTLIIHLPWAWMVFFVM